MNTIINNLSNLAKNNITCKSSLVQQYYFKGWSESIASSFETLGTLTFNEIHLLSSNSLVQLSSSSTSDTTCLVLVSGYDDTFNLVSETILCNGQNAVSSVNNYFRINSLRIVSGSGNLGNLYLSINLASLTAGVPNNQSDYLYSMSVGLNLGYILNGCIPPLVNGLLFPNYVIFSIANDTGNRCNFQFQMKKTSSSIWGTEFSFYTDERSNSQFMWRLDGVGTIPNNILTEGFDVRIKAKRLTGSGVLHASASISIRQSI